jgi:hypothetical protein
MTATLDDVTKKKSKREPTAEERAAEELRRAREQGLSLTGPDGLLKQLTKTVLETALNQEMTEHLGHEKHGPVRGETGNVRNVTRAKTVLTEATGQVPIEVPRDRDGSFEPQIVRKRQRRLSGVDQMVLSLYADRVGAWRSPDRVSGAGGYWRCCSCGTAASHAGRPNPGPAGRLAEVVTGPVCRVAGAGVRRAAIRPGRSRRRRARRR